MHDFLVFSFDFAVSTRMKAFHVLLYYFQKQDTLVLIFEIMNLLVK